MTPQMRTTLVRGQLALSVLRPEAKDFARFVAETLHAAQGVRLNEKATVAAVASNALHERKIVCLDISTKVLETQDFSPHFPENSSLAPLNTVEHTLGIQSDSIFSPELAAWALA